MRHMILYYLLKHGNATRMPKRPYQIRRPSYPKRPYGAHGVGRPIPVKIGNIFSPSTSAAPDITLAIPECRAEVQLQVTAHIPSLFDSSPRIPPKRYKPETKLPKVSASPSDKKKTTEEQQGILPLILSEENPEKTKEKKKKKKEPVQLEYPDNNLLKRRIHLSCDPLDDIFDRFIVPRTAPPVIDLEQSMTEMVETPRMPGGSSLDETTASEYTLVDADSTLGISQLVQIDSVSDDGEEIVFLGETSGVIQKPSKLNVSEAVETKQVVIEKEEIVLDDDEVVLVENSSLEMTSIRMELLSTTIDEIGITPETLKHAAMEDSLVKGTAQEYGTLIRHWELVKKLSHKPNVKDTVIRICTYNILCQETMKKTAHLYRHLISTSNEYQLYWDHRWPLLKQNLEHINADIFGLQEVQDTHFQQYINPLMTNLGFGSMWTPKTKVPTLNNRDGCALFYRRDKFEYIFSKQVEYYCGQGMCLDRPQIGQILRLKEKTTQKEIVIANTHILFNMKRGDIKLGQLSMLLANLRAEMDDHGEAPLIIMGDFNMDRLSHLYKFITEGRLFLKGLPRSCLASEKDRSSTPTVDLNEILPPKVQIGRDSKFFDKKNMKPGQFPIFSVQKSKVPADTITHPFNLWTAQAPLFGRKIEDEISTYHIDHGNPDFIFYTIKEKQVNGSKRTIFETPNLRLHRRVTLPTIAECQDTLGPWPNKHVPSDHIPLIVEFQLRGDPVNN